MATILAGAWTLLTSRLAGPIAAVVALALLVMLGLAHVQIGSLKRQRDALNAEISTPVTGWAARLATCQAGASTLKASLDRQSAAVEALKRDGEARVAASEKAAQAARSVAEIYRRTADAILSAKPASADACKAAEQLIMESVR